jgi:hypothetical protein
MYTDVWRIIKETLKDEVPIATYILVANSAYGHSARQISKSINIPPEEVVLWLEDLKLRIKNNAIEQGLNPKHITNLFAIEEIVEVVESFEDEIE